MTSRTALARRRAGQRHEQATRRSRAAIPESSPQPAAGRGAARATIACLITAALVHALMVGVHTSEWLAAGLFFLAMALAQGVLAAALAISTARWVYLATIGVNLAVIAVWGVSRSVGMPLGPSPWRAEPAGQIDMLTTVIEAGACLAAARALRLATPRRAG